MKRYLCFDFGSTGLKPDFVNIFKMTMAGILSLLKAE